MTRLRSTTIYGCVLTSPGRSSFAAHFLYASSVGTQVPPMLLRLGSTRIVKFVGGRLAKATIQKMVQGSLTTIAGCVASATDCFLPQMKLKSANQLLGVISSRIPHRDAQSFNTVPPSAGSKASVAEATIYCDPLLFIQKSKINNRQSSIKPHEDLAPLEERIDD